MTLKPQKLFLLVSEENNILYGGKRRQNDLITITFEKTDENIHLLKVLNSI